MLRVIRLLIFIAAILAYVYQAGAQAFPPAPFTLNQPGVQNTTLFRMDQTAGCPGEGLEAHTLKLSWQDAEWPVGHPNYDTAVIIDYTVVFRIDSATAGGSLVKVERSLPSDDAGRGNRLTLPGDALYAFLWTDGIPVEQRTDSLVMELQWYVIATNGDGLSTHSDTAGVSKNSAEVPMVTPPLVVSLNRPPSGTVTLLVPTDGVRFFDIAGMQSIAIFWNGESDVNQTLGKKMGLFHSYNSVTREWVTPLKYTGEPERTIDTLLYQWRCTVVDAWPKPAAGTIGKTIVQVSKGTYGAQLQPHDFEFLFNGLASPDVDSLVLEHCLLVNDGGFQDAWGPIPFPYREGKWENLAGATWTDTANYSAFGCRPHIMRAGCWTMFLAKSPSTGIVGPSAVPGEMTLRAYPNPSSGSANVQFTLPAASTVRLAVNDVLGCEVALLYEGPQPGGENIAHWTAPHSLPRGMYLVALETGLKRVTLPLVLR